MDRTAHYMNNFIYLFTSCPCVQCFIILTIFDLQTQNRMKLMADNYEDDHLKTASDQTNHKPSPDQVAYLTTNYSCFHFILNSFSKMSVIDLTMLN